MVDCFKENAEWGSFLYLKGLFADVDGGVSCKLLSYANHGRWFNPKWFLVAHLQVIKLHHSVILKIIDDITFRSFDYRQHLI